MQEPISHGGATPSFDAGPLYVDLDGTLVATDLLHESVLLLVHADTRALWRLPVWLAGGKARLKEEVAQRTSPDVERLPYRPEVIVLIRQARKDGRRVVLATASHGRIADRIARHLGLFDAVIASDGRTNRAGANKLEAIVADAAGAPFTYAGNSTADLPIWRQAAVAVVVDASASLAARVREIVPDVRTLAPAGPTWRALPRALRLHQWLKNLLLALPLLPVIGILQPRLLAALGLAFVAFGAMASAVYVVNDLLDLESDRRHARKRERPFASGRLSIATGVVLAAGLCSASLAIALVFLPGAFTVWLLAYIALTTAYSLVLKRIPVVDVLVLAGLYALRILAGAAAFALPVTLWILSFSTFLFTSLAFAKRYVEIDMAHSGEDSAVEHRGYRPADRQFVMAAGIAAGQIAVLVLNLYLNDANAMRHYRHPELMWLIGPLLLFWVLRIWFVAVRRQLPDDPVVFAARDRVSQVIVIASVLLVAAGV